MIRYAYVVDDDDAVRSSLHVLLSTRSDLVIRGFSSGDAFLRLIDDLDPGVILLDVRMPGLSGIDVLKKVRALTPSRFETILVTGHGNIAMAVEAMRGGAFDFLEKPYDHRTLLDVMDRAYAKLDSTTEHEEDQTRARERLQSLSQRERDVLLKLIDGHPNKQIAKDLGLSPRTVEYYRANLMGKLAVKNLSEALRLSFKAGIFEN